MIPTSLEPSVTTSAPTSLSAINSSASNTFALGGMEWIWLPFALNSCLTVFIGYLPLVSVANSDREAAQRPVWHRLDLGQRAWDRTAAGWYSIIGPGRSARRAARRL